MNVKENNYIINKTWGKLRIELVFPSYNSVNGDLGYYWDLGISISKGKESSYFHVGLILGWLKIVKYV